MRFERIRTREREPASREMTGFEEHDRPRVNKATIGRSDAVAVERAEASMRGEEKLSSLEGMRETWPIQERTKRGTIRSWLSRLRTSRRTNRSK